MKKKQIFGISQTSQLVPPNCDHDYFNHQNHPLSPQIGQFQMRTAWWLAEISMLAYSKQDFVKEKIEPCGIQVKKYYFSPETDTDCYLFLGDKFAIIAFRGTEFISFKEWRGNFEFQPIGWRDKAKVHTGFKTALDDVWEKGGLGKDLHQLLDMDAENRTFWFTGHSLGAAIATLAADRFYHEIKPGTKKERIGLYTYGSPRVGNKEFSKKYPVKTAYRFVNNSDMVTRVPPSWLLRYRHVGWLKYIDRKNYIHDNDPGKLFRFIDRCLGPFWGRRDDKKNRKYWMTLLVYLLSESIIDHAPILYANRIWNFNINRAEF